jgi:hypothetical protein
MKRQALILSAALLSIAATGCLSRLGSNTVNLTGKVLTDGKLIDASATISSNSVGLGGGLTQGSNSYSGTATLTQ